MHVSDKKGDLLPQEAEAIISVCEKIICQHQNLGPASPLAMNLIASLSLRTSTAKEKHREGLKYKMLMESAWRERDHYLVSSERDLMSDLRSIQAALLERDADLSDWGFH
ncbi:MAG TPA: hypothetical protein VFK94_01000, partial [Patescibacteria group bacterium]|nr:hypothetical protein [Patescibacteria group bacterium]